MAVPRGAPPAQLLRPPLTDPRLDREIRSLVQRLRLWTPTRWAAAAEPWGTRADLVRHLAQSFVDLADGAGRVLPVLAPDLLVADQLAVTGDDLVRSGPGEQVERDVLAHLLMHRYELLGEEPPAGLGGPGLLVHGRAVCRR